MLIHALGLSLALQQALAPAAPSPGTDSPIARLVVHPQDRTMIAGNTLRLRLDALDVAGNPVPKVTVRFTPGRPAGGMRGARWPSSSERRRTTTGDPQRVVRA